MCGFHVAFIMVHLPSFTIDQGLPSWVGPTALSVVGIANIVGTFIAGQSGRFIEKRRALSLIYFGRAVLFLGFLYLPVTPASVIVICGLLGLLWLSTIPLTSGLVATFFGTQWMSMLFGIVFLSHQVGSFLGVWLGGRIFDMTKSYDAMWWISIALGAGGRADQLADPGEAGGEAGGRGCPAPGRRIGGNVIEATSLGAAT